MSGEPLLRFGVEVEVVLVPKKPNPNMKRFDLATNIADHHNKEFNTNTDLRMKALPENPGTILKKGGYKKWGLVKDGTIVNNKAGDCKCTIADAHTRVKRIYGSNAYPF